MVQKEINLNTKKCIKKINLSRVEYSTVLGYTLFIVYHNKTLEWITIQATYLDVEMTRT